MDGVPTKMIIFLDFDGVLHPITDTEPDFCRKALLWEILRACPDAEIVFSTSWKQLYRFDELLCYVINGGGEDLERRFIGTTPSIIREQMTNKTSAARREQECRLWLSGNGHSQSWIAIDDTAVFFTAACPTLYLVDKETGLTSADVSNLIARIRQKVN